MKKFFSKITIILILSLSCILFAQGIHAEENSVNTKSDTIILRGKIFVSSDSSVYLITKWNTRSKKTYLITGENIDEIKKNNGKIIEAECRMLEKKAWSGKIEILNYKISELKKKSTKIKKNNIKK